MITFSIKDEYSLIEDDIVVAGASQGGSISIINFALEIRFANIKKFIAVIPSIGDVSLLTSLLENGIKKGGKGYIIAGEMDNFMKKIKNFF